MGWCFGLLLFSLVWLYLFVPITCFFLCLGVWLCCSVLGGGCWALLGWEPLHIITTANNKSNISHNKEKALLHNPFCFVLLQLVFVIIHHFKVQIIVVVTNPKHFYSCRQFGYVRGQVFLHTRTTLVRNPSWLLSLHFSFKIDLVLVCETSKKTILSWTQRDALFLAAILRLRSERERFLLSELKGVRSFVNLCIKIWLKMCVWWGMWFVDVWSLFCWWSLYTLMFW